MHQVVLVVSYLFEDDTPIEEVLAPAMASIRADDNSGRLTHVSAHMWGSAEAILTAATSELSIPLPIKKDEP